MSREFLVRKVTVAFTAFMVVLFIPFSIAFTQEKPNPLRIVVLGDSLSAGYGLAPGETFPEKLQKALKAQPAESHNIIIENAGVSGDTSSGGLARLNWSVPQGTQGVILELGANDALRGISPALTDKNLLKIITQLKARNIEILLTGMIAPPNMGEEYAKEFNSIYMTLAAKEDLIFYPFFLDGVAGNTELNQADAIHPTAKGIDIIIENILPTVNKFITKIQTR